MARRAMIRYQHADLSRDLPVLRLIYFTFLLLYYSLKNTEPVVESVTGARAGARAAAGWSGTLGRRQLEQIHLLL